MRHKRGRPRCSKLCCQEGGDKVLEIAYIVKGLSAREIGELLDVSDAHVVKKLHEYEVLTKGRGRYLNKKSGAPRRSKLWGLSDQELFKTPVDELAFKYQMSHGGVDYVRSKRRSQKTSEDTDA